MLNIDYKFLIVSYIIGMFIDWVFQSQWQAINKSKWSKSDNKVDSFYAVFMHSLIYSSITSCVLSMLYVLPQRNFWFTFIVLWASHCIIDTRIPVKLILRAKGMSKEQILDYNTYGFMHIGIDHRLHEIILLILAIILGNR